MQDGRAKRAKLADLGRKSFVSMSAIAALIEDLQDADLPGGCSRSSILRARTEAADVATPFGPVLRTLNMELSGGVPHALEIISPLPMLVHSLSQSEALAAVFTRALERSQPNVNKPWRIILYSDEVAALRMFFMGRFHHAFCKMYAQHCGVHLLAPAKEAHPDRCAILRGAFVMNAQDKRGAAIGNARQRVEGGQQAEASMRLLVHCRVWVKCVVP
jgi:hypothetical protein